MLYLSELVGPEGCALRHGGVRSLAHPDPHDDPQVRPPQRFSRSAPAHALSAAGSLAVL
jgi:hypothetical protein